MEGDRRVLDVCLKDDISKKETGLHNLHTDLGAFIFLSQLRTYVRAGRFCAMNFCLSHPCNSAPSQESYPSGPDSSTAVSTMNSHTLRG